MWKFVDMYQFFEEHAPSVSLLTLQVDALCSLKWQYLPTNISTKTII